MNFQDRLISVLLEATVLLEGRRLHGGRREGRRARKARQRKPEEDSSSAELSTDPQAFGATITGTPKSQKSRRRVKKLKRFEPQEKMRSAASRAAVDDIIKRKKAGEKMKPIVVTKHGTVIDGHHRLQAALKTGDKVITTVSPGKVTKK